MLLQTAGTNWDLRTLFGAFWPLLLILFPIVGVVAAVGLAIYLRRQDRQRNLARQPKAGN